MAPDDPHLAEPDLAKKPGKKSPNIGEDTHPGGVDRDSLPDSDFAGPHRSFPITSPGDVSDAMSLAHHADDPDAVRSSIRAIARRKGFPVPGDASKVMTNWPVTSTGSGPLPGQAAWSPANSAPGAGRHPTTGQFINPNRAMLAQGHYVSPDRNGGGDPGDPQRIDMHLDMQPPGLRIQPLASLATVQGTGPLASSIACHQGMASVARFDAASYASPFLAQQLSQPPSGDPSRSGGPYTTTPTGYGATTGITPTRPQSSPYLPGAPGGGLRPQLVPPVAAPGAMYTTPVPGE
jgi:hypothetical protein